MGVRFPGRATVALLCVALVGGCSIGDVRRPVPPPAPVPEPAAPAPAPASTPRAAADVDEVRRVRVPVPQRYDQPHVEFVDADRGYALFATCLQPTSGAACPAILLGTVDGGRRWRVLPHPRPVAENHQLYVSSQGTVLLLAEPHGWWAGNATGTRFGRLSATTDPLPAVVRSLTGRFQLDEATGRVGQWRDGRFRLLARQPPVDEPNSVVEVGGRLVVAGTPGGRPKAAISTDQGRSWQGTEIARVSDEPVTTLRVVADPTGGIWLLGEPENRNDFPGIWKLADDRWFAFSVIGQPDRVRSVVPIDGALLLVTGPAGSGVVTWGSYRDHGWPLADDPARVLADGTILAVRSADGDIVLGTGTSLDRRWIRLVLERSD